MWQKEFKPSEDIAKDIGKELLKLLELKQEEVKKNNYAGFTQYSEGKIDGLNIAIKILEKFLDL